MESQDDNKMSTNAIFSTSNPEDRVKSAHTPPVNADSAAIPHKRDDDSHDRMEAHDNDNDDSSWNSMSANAGRKRRSFLLKTSQDDNDEDHRKRQEDVNRKNTHHFSASNRHPNESSRTSEVKTDKDYDIDKDYDVDEEEYSDDEFDDDSLDNRLAEFLVRVDEMAHEMGAHQEGKEGGCDCWRCTKEAAAKAEARIAWEKELKEEPDQDLDAPQCAICFRCNQDRFIALPCCGTGDKEDSSTTRFCRPCIVKTLVTQREMKNECFLFDGHLNKAYDYLLDRGEVMGECPRCKGFIVTDEFKAESPIRKASISEALEFIRDDAELLPLFVLHLGLGFADYIPCESIIESILSEMQIPGLSDNDEAISLQVEKLIQHLLKLGILQKINRKYDQTGEKDKIETMYRFAFTGDALETQRMLYEYITDEDLRPTLYEDQSQPSFSNRIDDATNWKQRSWEYVGNNLIKAGIASLVHFEIVKAWRLVNQGLLCHAKRWNLFPVFYQSPLFDLITMFCAGSLFVLLLTAGVVVGAGIVFVHILSWCSSKARIQKVQSAKRLGLLSRCFAYLRISFVS